MAASVTSLCNRSLLSIGARAQISDLNEGSVESDACSVLFSPTFEALARSANWNCLRKQITLSLIRAAQGTPENPDGTSLPLPTQPWLYEYLLPSDSLEVRFILPTYVNAGSGSSAQTPVNNLAPTAIPNQGQIPYVVAYDVDASNNPLQVILTNQTQAQAVYTVNQPNPIVWDSLFQQAMVASLAAYLVPALSLNLDLMKISIRTAEAAIQMARVRDGNEGVTCMDRNADWMTARMTGSLYNYNDNAWNGGITYPNMAWPSF